MKKRILPLLALSTLILLQFSCSKKEVDLEFSNYYTDYETMKQYLDIENAAPLDYVQKFPKHAGELELDFNDDLAFLGKVLFYDTNLSEDRSISCASCHKQSLAFADDKALSEGVGNQVTARNSISLGSVFSFQQYYGDPSFGLIPFFWDNRASSVAEQAEQTFGNAQEMNMPMHQVVDRVREMPYYRNLFQYAYESEEIDEERILGAISEFINSIGSHNSRYDKALDEYVNDGGNTFTLENKALNGFSEEENLGKDLFLMNCSSCHSRTNTRPPVLARNNGLDYSNNADGGVGELTNNPSEMGHFKVPTLRNIAQSAPYMHDGRFETLEEVIDHYSNNIQSNPNLSAELKDIAGNPIRFNFTAAQKNALIAFLKTMTDEEFLNDERYSDPFKR